MVYEKQIIYPYNTVKITICIVVDAMKMLNCKIFYLLNRNEEFHSESVSCFSLHEEKNILPIIHIKVLIPIVRFIIYMVVDTT